MGQIYCHYEQVAHGTLESYPANPLPGRAKRVDFFLHPGGKQDAHPCSAVIWEAFFPLVRAFFDQYWLANNKLLTFGLEFALVPPEF